MQIRNGEVALHVAVDGELGRRPILLLHGITSSGRTWDWLVPHLEAAHRVIRLDFRGHGRSDRAAGSYQLADYLSDAVAACRQVATEPCVVIGHSLGGVTAAALAQLHPDLVTAVALEDPPLGVSRELEGNALLDVFRLMRASIPRLQADGIPVAVLADVLGRAPSPTGTPFGDLLRPDALRSMAEAMLELDATVLDPVIEGRMQPVFDPAQPIGAPTLLMTADPSSPDATVRPGDVQQLTVTSPHAEVRVMRGASHLIHDEIAHRDEFRDEVLGFLERVGGRG